MLSEKQTRAITMMLAGKRQQEILDAVEISRTELFRWRKEDAEFIAEFNMQKEEIAAGHKAALNSLFARAIEVLRDGMTPREAMEIVRLYLGGAGPVGDMWKSGPTDAGEIRKSQAALERFGSEYESLLCGAGCKKEDR